MDELKHRIKTIFEEVESTYLRKTLRNNLTIAGIDEGEARNWTLEIGEIVDEYERSLHLLMDLTQEANKEHIIQKLESWLAYTEDISLFKIGDIVKYLQDKLQKYLPPNSEDEDDPS